MTVGTTYHDEREPGVVRYGFLCCPSCLSLVRADLTTLTVRHYGQPDQTAVYRCPACGWITEQPDVLLISAQTIVALRETATTLRDVVAEGQSEKDQANGNRRVTSGAAARF